MRFIFLLLLVSISAFANKRLDCDHWIKPKKHVTLIATHDRARIFIIENISDQSILLNKLNPKHQSMSAGWGSYLDAKQWSGLIVYNEHFQLGCFSPTGQTLDCTKAIKICRSKMDIKADNTFWRSENKSLTNLQADLAKN